MVTESSAGGPGWIRLRMNSFAPSPPGTRSPVLNAWLTVELAGIYRYRRSKEAF